MEYQKEQLDKIHNIELELYHTFADICKRHKLTFVTGFGTTLGAVRHHGFIPWDDDMDFLMPRKDYEKFVKICMSELKEPYELLEPRTKDGYVMAFAKLSRKDSTFVEEVDSHLKYNTGIFIDIFPMDFWPQNKRKRNHIAFRCYVLARLMSLATYKKPKLPKGMTPLKRRIAYLGCGIVHTFLQVSGLNTRRLYKKYRKYATITTKEEAENYVTDMCWCWIRKLKAFKYEMFGLQYKYSDLFTVRYQDFEQDKIPIPDNYESYLNIAYPNYMTLPPEEKRHSHKPAVLIFPDEKEKES